MSRETISIIGAGAMGHGLAVHFANFRHPVMLVDHQQENLDRAASQIKTAAEFLSHHSLTTMKPASLTNQIELTTDRKTAVEDVPFVLETIAEDLERKRDLFAALAEETTTHAILMSNTSGIPITDIASTAPAAADRIIGCHWWYPPYLLEPVEVIRGERTADTTIERVKELLTTVDRDPIMVERDVPGFVWNRVQHAVIRECLHIVESGIASATDVNRAIRDGYATRTAAIGPLETVDIAGLNLFRTTAADIYPDLCDRSTPNPSYDTLIEQKKTGIEVGAGFFEYATDPAAITDRRDAIVAAIRGAKMTVDRPAPFSENEVTRFD